MEASSSANVAPPTPATVIAAAAQDAFPLDGVVERVTIERAGDLEYIGRIYLVGADDYESIWISFA